MQVFNAKFLKVCLTAVSREVYLSEVFNVDVQSRETTRNLNADVFRYRINIITANSVDSTLGYLATDLKKSHAIIMCSRETCDCG